MDSMSSIKSGPFCSSSDYDSGRRMYAGMMRSISDYADIVPSYSISPENLLHLLRMRTKSSADISTGMQVELALLWRTLSILRYSVGIPGVLQSFYEELLKTITETDSLSLSTIHNDNSINSSSSISSRNKNHDRKIANTVEEIDSTAGSDSDTKQNDPINFPADKTSSSQFIFQVPELAYLRDVEDQDDPLGIVQKLFNSAECSSTSLPSSEKGPMNSVCLALAIKSGRLSLLLQAASILMSTTECTEQDLSSQIEFKRTNLILLNDVLQYLNTAHKNRKISVMKSLKSNYQQISNFSIPFHFQKQKSNTFHFENLRRINDNTTNNGIFYNNALHNDCFNREKHRITLSFGKADHGKLGLGESQVICNHP